MNKKETLLLAISESMSNGGSVFTGAELAYMVRDDYSPAFRKFISDCVKKGLLRRVAKGVYESVFTPPSPSTAIYKIANKLRPGLLNYISLESQLSHTGDISQIVMDRLTVMTKGRSGEFKTLYGVIEFVHTKKQIDRIAPNLYVDSDVGMYRANTAQAISDLKSCNRNLHMLEK